MLLLVTSSYGRKGFYFAIFNISNTISIEMVCTYKASASSQLYARYSFPETSDCSYKCTQ